MIPPGPPPRPYAPADLCKCGDPRWQHEPRLGTNVHVGACMAQHGGQFCGCIEWRKGDG